RVDVPRYRRTLRKGALAGRAGAIIPGALDVHRHPEAAAQRPSKDERPLPGRRPPISGLPEIGTIARKSATADLRSLASRAPQGDGNESDLPGYGSVNISLFSSLMHP